MDLIEGEVIEQGKNLKEIDFKGVIIKLINSKFSGYINLLIEGFDGLEEGTIVMRTGSIIASSYEYLKHGIIVNGNPAVPQFFNAAGAAYGVLDIYSFKPTDAELVIAVNPKVRVTIDIRQSDIDKLYKKIFSDVYAKKILAMVSEQKPSKYEALKKLGLGEVVESET
ncbi:MAG: DUF2226 domain-containing protein [Candidatus Diapherotrites archaeon]